MTTNPSVTGALRSPRTLAAWALLAYVAVLQFFAFFNWILPGGGSFASRAAEGQFTDLFFMAMPVIAVLLAVHVQPVLAGAKLIALIALAEYAVSLFFGAITFLIGFGAVFSDLFRYNSGFYGLQYLVIGILKLALIAIAAYAVFQAYQKVGGKLSFGSPKPAAYQTGTTPEATSYQQGAAQVRSEYPAGEPPANQ